MSAKLQQQIRDNSRELNDFLKDLSDWTGEVKEKDQALLLNDTGCETADARAKIPSASTSITPPPIRGRIDSHRVKSEEDLVFDKLNAKKKQKQPSSATQAPKNEKENSSTSKDMGNACFKNGDYTTAIMHYTRCIEQDGGSCAAYANRAMCGIKLGKWSEAETDCTEALKLEPTYLKAYQRRGLARRKLGRYLESTFDFEEALRLEPHSKILVNERNESKSAYELQAHLRPTQSRRVVRIDLPVKSNEKSTFLPQDLGDETANTAGGSTAMNISTASTSSPSVKKPTPITLGPPRTGAEFEGLWNRLKADPSRRLDLMRMTAPDAIPSIFKSGIAPRIFTGIVRLCLEGHISKTLSTAFPILKALTKIPRFDMAVMFITGSERKELQSAWDRAVLMNEETIEQDMSLLRKKYKL